MSLFLTLSFLSALLNSAAAQTWTSCNPLNQTCPSDTALGISNATFNFATSSADSNVWNTTAGNIVYGDQGAEFTIANKGDSPTMQSKFYIFFGEVEVWLKAAPGQGVVSTVVLQSDDLDEIDLEFVGSNTTHAENNYYGKGNKTNESDRAKWYPMSGSPQAGLHNYTTRWTNTSLDWYIDGTIVRTVHPNDTDALNGKGYPQTPMNVRIGVWAGGDPKNDNYTIAWAGGEIDYTKGPYTMYVPTARITDFSTGSTYTYGDNSGNWQSIKIATGNSTIAHAVTAGPPETMKQRWSGLSSGAKVAIYASVGAFIALTLGLWALCCVKHRRAGRREGALADAAFEKDTAELIAYRAQYGKNQSRYNEFAASREEF